MKNWVLLIICCFSALFSSISVGDNGVDHRVLENYSDNSINEYTEEYGSIRLENLEGDWVSSCISDAFLDYYYKAIQSFRDGVETTSIVHFTDPSCTVKDFVEYSVNERRITIDSEYFLPDGLPVSKVSFSDNRSGRDYSYYTIARIDNDKLYFGDTLSNPEIDGRSPQNRPSNLSYEIVFTRTNLYSH